MDYYSCKEVVERPRLSGRSPDKSKRMARFVHSAVRSEKVPIGLHIDKFSMVLRRGYYEGPAFQSDRSDSQWSLIVYASEGEAYEDFIDIRLRRNASDGRDQFVELKLTIDDYFRLGALTEEGQFCFGSRDTHKVMSVPRKYMSPFYKLRYLPNDTLTVRGEMTIYEEDQRPFESEGDFENSRKISNFAACLAVGRWILPKLLIVLLAAIVGYFAVYAICHAIHYAIYNVIVPFLHDVVLPLLIEGLVLGAAFYWLWGEIRKHFFSERPAARKKPGNSAIGRELVPVTHGGYKQTKKHGMSGQGMIYVLDARDFYRRKDRYLYG